MDGIFSRLSSRVDAYNEIIGKLVLRSTVREMGFLSSLQPRIGAPPFERFYMGGTGMYNGEYDGRELIPLRSCKKIPLPQEDKTVNITPAGGGTLYNGCLWN